jgi:arylsulfatase A-like enzyme
MRKRFFRAYWPWLAAALILAGYASTLLELRPGDPRPSGSAASIARLSERDDINVLFILVDTLRADRLGGYGYQRETSPSIDYLADSGVRFTRHLAQSSWTKSSMASLWTGLNPARTSVLRFDHAVPPEATLPAEIFRAAGFRTAGIWRNGWVGSNFGFAQGFEVYDRPIPGRPPAPERRAKPHISLEGTDNDVVDAAIEFLRVRGQERWFLYVHLMDVHQYTFDEAAARFGTAHSDLYDNAILHEDGIVGRLLLHLADHGYLEKTLVVLSSDHGEAFRERGFEGHARKVYREETEVPFILGFPFRLDGAVVDARTRNIDVWPTVLDLIGLPPLPDTDGRSLVPLILAAARREPLPNDEHPGFSHLDRTWGSPGAPPAPLVAVARGGFRFVYAPTPAGGVREELFDRSADELERRDVLAQHPDVALSLRELVKRYLESPAGPWGVETPTIELDEMELNQLRALGYEVP